jgi:hypothetical protein
MIKKDLYHYKKKVKIKEYHISENSIIIKNLNLQKNNHKRDYLKLVHLKKILELIYSMRIKIIWINKRREKKNKYKWYRYRFSTLKANS